MPTLGVPRVVDHGVSSSHATHSISPYGSEDEADAVASDPDRGKSVFDDAEDVKSTSSIAPLPALLDQWKKLLNFPRVLSSSSSSQSLGPKAKRPIQRWADLDKAPEFASFRREDCLHSSFEAVSKKHPDLLKLASHVANASGAAAHAILSASSARRPSFFPFLLLSSFTLLGGDQNHSR